MTPSFKALIFDLDGTLVDSSKVVHLVMERWCLKNGIPLQTVLEACHGERTEDTVSRVAPHLCAKSEAIQIEHMESATLEGLLPVGGADRFLINLEKEMWAIATSSSIITAKQKLESCRMPIPDVFITAESVGCGKPHPEPFLKAAAALGIPPSECLVFEDADNGVRSALTAGCLVFIIGNSCQIEHSNIIGRASTFDEVTLTKSGELIINSTTIANYSKKTGPGEGDLSAALRASL